MRDPRTVCASVVHAALTGAKKDLSLAKSSCEGWSDLQMDARFGRTSMSFRQMLQSDEDYVAELEEALHWLTKSVLD